MSNPDGINIITIDGQSFALIQEDLNGSSFGRVPSGVGNRTCEVFLLDLSIEDPTVDDLVRLTAVPAGAEATGGIMTSDGKSLLINSQHPNTTLEFPWNHSLTFAINGLDNLTVTSLKEPNFDETKELQLFPNPTTRMLHLSERIDFAIYDNAGKRLKVFRNTDRADVSTLNPGLYYLQTGDQTTYKFVVE